ncbi:MAG: T9SS type A sorting domain-containing protein [Bacteroidales bacterium]
MNQNLTFHFFFALLFLCGIFDSRAQTILTYTYDRAGNRIQKNVIILKSAVNLQSSDSTSVQQKEDGKDIPFEEKAGELLVKIYPNPVSFSLNIEISGTDNTIVWGYSLFGLNGRLLYNKKTSAEKENIDLSHFQPGIYILHIEGNDARLKWTIIKE